MADEGNMTWRKVTTTGNHPAPRDSHSMSSWNNNLIVLGGEDAANSFLSDIYILDTGKHGGRLHPFRHFSENYNQQCTKCYFAFNLERRNCGED